MLLLARLLTERRSMHAVQLILLGLKCLPCGFSDNQSLHASVGWLPAVMVESTKICCIESLLNTQKNLALKFTVATPLFFLTICCYMYVYHGVF